MIVSREHRFVFVHIQKTGGDTVRHLLGRHFDNLTEVAAKHDPARKGEIRLNEWNGFYSFAFVRNPWARLVSWYRMIAEASRLKWYHKFLGERKRSHYHQAQNNKLWRYVLQNSSSFEGFIKHCTGEVTMHDSRPTSRYSFTRNQVEYVTDEEGNVIVDFVGRFENYEADLRTAFAQIGVDLGPLPHKNTSSHRHYSTYYTPETRAIVRDRFRRDIDYFGYEFESV